MLIIDGCRGSAFPTNLPDSITIGWEADQYAYDIPLDISQEMARWPGSVPVLIYSRPGEKNTVQPAVTTLSGTTLFWSPDAYATAIHGGSGLAQIVFTTAGDPVIVGHSKVIKLAIFASLEASEDPPEPYETWIQSLLDAAAEAVDAAEAAIAAAEMIKTITASATTLPAGSRATASYNDGHLSLGIPKGDQGDTGETGATPNLTIGTVTTLPPGSDATAEITGTPEDPVLSLGIPEGDQGERGPIGPTPNLTIGTVSTLPTGSDATAEITGTPEDPVLNLGLPRGEPGEVTEAQLQAVADSKADVIIETAAPGSVVTINDGANNAPIKSMTVQINPVQGGEGDPSPTNIRPITGWTGSNIINQESVVTYGSIGSGYYDANGNTQSSPQMRRTLNLVEITPNTTYVFNYASSSSTQSKLRVQEYDSNGNWLRAIYETSVTTIPTIYSFVASSDAHYIKFSCPIYSTLRLYKAFALFKIDFPQEAGTVYGGTLTINEDGTGTLTVEKAIASSLEWTDVTSSDIKLFRAQPANKATGAFNLICDRYPTAESGHGFGPNMIDKTIVGNSSNRYIYVRDDDYANAEAFATANTGIQIVYNIRNTDMLIYQLTAAQIMTVLGLNNIFADTGEITAIEYRADTKLYIDLAGQTEEDMTASGNIATGTYFQIGNKLYLATAAITAGQTIIPGTNCTETTVAAALNALLS